jgi:type VI secretion system protein
MPMILTLNPVRGQGQRATRSLDRGTLSIGRGADNDWVLPDPDRHLSKTHCVVSIENGRCVLTDLSTNGVFVNGARDPISRDNRVILTDGDEFRLGDYSITATETDERASPKNAPGFGDAYVDPLSTKTGSTKAGGPLDIDPLDDPLGRPHDPAFRHPMPATPPPQRAEDPFDMLDERQPVRKTGFDDDLFHGITPSDNWAGPSQSDHSDAPQHAFNIRHTSSPVPPGEIDFDALLGDTPPGEPLPPRIVPSAEPTAAPVPSPAPRRAAAGPADPFDEPELPPPAPRAAASGAAIATASPNAEALLTAFLTGAGVPELKLPGQDAEAVMNSAGAVFRALVEGLRDVLMSRAAVKSEFRVEQTMLRPRDNNALKFSVTPEEAVAALLLPARTGYKPPLDAAREAFEDIRSHELAVMAGVQTALLGLLHRFDPAVLEKRLQPGMLDSVLPGARRARTWELFCITYKDITREAEDDFQSVFGREFARAYDAQTSKL